MTSPQYGLPLLCPFGFMVIVQNDCSVSNGHDTLFHCYPLSLEVIVKCSLELGSEDDKFKMQLRASLVAQWLRICLPVQGTRV